MVQDTGAQLVAVLRADVVGSTEYLATRGVGAAITSRGRSSDAIERACTGGRTLDKRGDGVLVGFPTVREALIAAADLQRISTTETDVRFRVAVMLHELVVDDDIFRSVEQRTALVESMCPPGDVVVGSRAARAVRGSDGLVLEPFAKTADGTAVHRLVGGSDNRDEDSADDPTAKTDLLRAVLFSDVAPVDNGSEAGPGRSNSDVTEIDDLSPSVAREISNRCIVAADGLVVDTNGGGHVALFSSCTAAMNAADAMHAEARSAALRADGRPPFGFRVGVAVGDVVTAAGALFGVAVVEAARLLATVEQAGTALSADVRALDGSPDRLTEAVGAVALKGLPAPVDVERRIGLDAVGAMIELPASLSRDQPFPMVGRDEQTAALRRLWAEATNGSVRGCVVSGEEGVGKSRLVAELAAEVHAAGAIVLHGSCDEDLRVPYAPVANALAAAITVDETLGLAADPDTGSGPLATLLHTAANSRADVGASLSDPLAAAGHAAEGSSPRQYREQRPLDRFELFDAVIGVMERLAADRPVLLVLDDIHWGDPDTVDLLEEILSITEFSRIAVVATCRAEHLGQGQPVQELLQSKRSSNRVEHLRLDRLTEADVQAMLRSGSPLDPSADELEIAAGIRRITGGSPLYIEELVGHLVAAGDLTNNSEVGWSLASVDGLTIPDSMVDLVAQRAGRLGDTTVQLLATAAILGASFEVEVLAEVSGWEIDRALDAIEAADQARLLHQDDGGEVCWFSDEIVREALLRTRRPTRRAVEHKRIAEVLERIRPHQIDRLAAHWSAAMGPDARAKAAHYLRLAGDRDTAAAAWELSADRYQKVLDLLAVDGVADDLLLGQVHYALGSSLRKLGDTSYRPALIKAAELARKVGAADLLARSAIAMMRPGAWYPEAAEVDGDIVAMCEDALLLMGPNDPLRPRVLSALAVNLTYDDDPAVRTELITEARELAEASGEIGLVGTALAAELISFPDPHLFARRRELAEEVRRIGRATGDRDLLFIGSWFVVLDLLSLGDLDGADRIVVEMAELVESTREYWPSFLVSHHKTALAIARCDVDAAEAIEDERSRFEHQPVDWFGISVIQSATVAMGHGTLSDMLLSLVAAADEYDNDSWAMKWNYALSRAYMESGDYEAALAAIAMNPEPDLDYYWLASTYHLGLVGLLTERPDLCQTVLTKLTPFRGRIAMIGLGACFSGQVSTSLGQAYLGLGRFDEAEELLREAMAQADALSFPYFATIARRFLALTIKAVRPEDPEIRRLLTRGAALADRYGLALEARELHLMIDDSSGAANR